MKCCNIRGALYNLKSISKYSECPIRYGSLPLIPFLNVDHIISTMEIQLDKDLSRVKSLKELSDEWQRVLTLDVYLI